MPTCAVTTRKSSAPNVHYPRQELGKVLNRPAG